MSNFQLYFVVSLSLSLPSLSPLCNTGSQSIYFAVVQGSVVQTQFVLNRGQVIILPSLHVSFCCH